MCYNVEVVKTTTGEKYIGKIQNIYGAYGKHYKKYKKNKERGNAKVES